MTKAKRKRIGRPPLPPEKKRGQTMGFKPTPEIRRLLQETAAANGRSVSKEIEVRLERSLLDQEAIYQAFGGRKSYEFCRLLATIANTGSDNEAWTRDIVQWWKTAPIGELLVKMYRGETIDLDEKPGTPQEEGLRLFAAMVGGPAPDAARHTAIAEGEQNLKDGLRRTARGKQSGDDSDRE